MHAGVAPIPASSGRTHRHRLARGGNRQLNATLHRIAITQIRITDSPGQLYYQRRRARGDSTMEAPPAAWPGSCSTSSNPPPAGQQINFQPRLDRGATSTTGRCRPDERERRAASTGTA